MTTATATKFSVVFDEAGVEIGRRQQTAKRRYSHALVRRAETVARVTRRHELRQASDIVLIAGLEAELAGAPSVRHAGPFGSGKIVVQPPVALRPRVDAVYANASAQDAAVAQYFILVSEALEAAQKRLSESREALMQLAEGEYVFAPAQVLRFAGSRVVAQHAMNAETSAAGEPHDLLGLAIVRTVETCA